MVIWKQLEGGLFDLYGIVPGCLFSLLAVVVVSLLDPAPEEEILAEFELVTRQGLQQQ